MRKLLVLCLIVFLVSCKDKDKDSVVDPDYAPAFAGVYTTTTIDNSTTTIVHQWEVTNTAKNLLAINYTKSIKVSVSGTVLTAVQIYKLANVEVTAEDSFTIGETVDVEQTTSDAFKAKLEGVATKVTNSSGNAQLNITLKITNTNTGSQDEGYLEFKKQS